MWKNRFQLMGVCLYTTLLNIDWLYPSYHFNISLLLCGFLYSLLAPALFPTLPPSCCYSTGVPFAAKSLEICGECQHNGTVKMQLLKPLTKQTSPTFTGIEASSWYTLWNGEIGVPGFWLLVTFGIAAEHSHMT